MTIWYIWSYQMHIESCQIKALAIQEKNSGNCRPAIVSGTCTCGGENLWALLVISSVGLKSTAVQIVSFSFGPDVVIFLAEQMSNSSVNGQKDKKTARARKTSGKPNLTSLMNVFRHRKSKLNAGSTGWYWFRLILPNKKVLRKNADKWQSWQDWSPDFVQQLHRASTADGSPYKNWGE